MLIDHDLETDNPTKNLHVYDLVNDSVVKNIVQINYKKYKTIRTDHCIVSKK